MRTATRYILGDLAALNLASHLVHSSQWFEFTPLPDGWYDFTVKEEAARYLPTVNGTTVRSEAP